MLTIGVMWPCVVFVSLLIVHTQNAPLDEIFQTGPQIHFNNCDRCQSVGPNSCAIYLNLLRNSNQNLQPIQNSQGIQNFQPSVSLGKRPFDQTSSIAEQQPSMKRPNNQLTSSSPNQVPDLLQQWKLLSQGKELPPVQTPPPAPVLSGHEYVYIGQGKSKKCKSCQQLSTRKATKKYCQTCNVPLCEDCWNRTHNIPTAQQSSSTAAAFKDIGNLLKTKPRKEDCPYCDMGGQDQCTFHKNKQEDPILRVPLTEHQFIWHGEKQPDGRKRGKICQRCRTVKGKITQTVNCCPACEGRPPLCPACYKELHP